MRRELIKKPKYKDIVGLKWVYKIKYNEDGMSKSTRHDLLQKGYSQQSSINFNETFTLVVRIETIRMVLALAVQLKLQVY